MTKRFVLHVSLLFKYIVNRVDSFYSQLYFVIRAFDFVAVECYEPFLHRGHFVFPNLIIHLQKLFHHGKHKQDIVQAFELPFQLCI